MARRTRLAGGSVPRYPHWPERIAGVAQHAVGCAAATPAGSGAVTTRGGDDGVGRWPPRGANSPTDAYVELVQRFGVSRGRLSSALHRIKKNAGLRPDTNTLVDGQGNVYIDMTGEWIGNLLDEAT